jgi:hypothetical protein
MYRKALPLILCGVPLLALATAARADYELKPEQFAALHKLIQPRAEEEKWLQIPWQASLWQARKTAAAEGKPILLWEMDGHPLGCT